MNIICVMLDSLRTDHVGAYGDRARTPNMDRIARESLVFSKAYSGSFPTLPCRRDLFTGRWGHPFNTWDKMEGNLPTMAERFRRAGYTTGLIFDTPMFMTQGNFLDRGFGSISWIRGQGGEPWISDELEEIAWPASEDKVKSGVMRYLANQRGRLFESDYLGPRVFTEAMHWLERNYVKDGFFLWIDSWDPHEPWDPPQYYVDMYDPGYEGDELIYPCYGFSNYMTDEELNHVRALYAAEVTMTDRWLGMLWDTIGVLGLKENTIFVLMADHGHYFGDHGLQGKPWGDWGQLYDPMIHIPFMVYHPDGMMAGKQVDSLVQPVDVFPTLCDLAGLDVPNGVQGKAFADVLQGKTVMHRDFAISGRNLNDSWGTVPATITDGTWTLVYWPNKDLKYKGPKQIRIERYDCRNMPERRVDELFYMPEDPGQENNVIADHPEEARRLHDALRQLIEDTETDPEIAKTYLPAPGDQYQ